MIAIYWILIKKLLEQKQMLLVNLMPSVIHIFQSTSQHQLRNLQQGEWQSIKSKLMNECLIEMNNLYEPWITLTETSDYYYEKVYINPTAINVDNKRSLPTWVLFCIWQSDVWIKRWVDPCSQPCLNVVNNECGTAKPEFIQAIYPDWTV